MDNNFNQQVSGKPAKMNVLELVALICSAVGTLMAVLGTIFTCSCSASKSIESEADGYSISAVFIVTIIGIVIAVAGVVLAIAALKSNGAAKASKLAYIAAVLGVFAVLYGTIPTVTICGYNCSLDSAAEDMEKDMETYSYFGM